MKDVIQYGVIGKAGKETLFKLVILVSFQLEIDPV